MEIVLGNDENGEFPDRAIHTIIINIGLMERNDDDEEYLHGDCCGTDFFAGFMQRKLGIAENP